MALFGFLKSNKRPSIEDMMGKASQWTDYYMDHLALKQGAFIRGGMFVFTSWAVWDYCLRNDRIPKGDIANEYIASTLVYSGFDRIMDPVDFLEVFRTRFKIFNADMTGLSNSHYPQTKQYIPYTTYCTIYQNQLSLTPTAGVDRQDYEIREEVFDFTGGFIKYWNLLLKDLEKSYK